MVRDIFAAEAPFRCNILLQSFDEHNFYLSSEPFYSGPFRLPLFWYQSCYINFTTNKQEVNMNLEDIIFEKLTVEEQKNAHGGTDPTEIIRPTVGCPPG
jgi:hypothetical protein